MTMLEQITSLRDAHAAKAKAYRLESQLENRDLDYVGPDLVAIQSIAVSMKRAADSLEAALGVLFATAIDAVSREEESRKRYEARNG